MLAATQLLISADPSDAPHQRVHLQAAGLPHNPGPVHQSASPAQRVAHAVHGRGGVRGALGGVRAHGPGAARCSRAGHSHAVHGDRERREPQPVRLGRGDSNPLRVSLGAAGSAAESASLSQG